MTIPAFNSQALTNGAQEMKKDWRTVLYDILFILAGIFFRFSWPALWMWAQGGVPRFEQAIIPTMILALGGAIMVLASTWKLLEQTDRRVRWAFAFFYGAGAAFIAQPPTEWTLVTLGIIS